MRKLLGAEYMKAAFEKGRGFRLFVFSQRVPVLSSLDNSNDQ